MIKLVRIEHYQSMADYIRSGQLSQSGMLEIFKSDLLFCIWYKHKYCIKPEWKANPKVFSFGSY